jgi:2-oxoisovalerate dehydrogenase E2 component (dihydrolipoyl transacylase)
MINFILPDIGEGIVECEILKWLVAEGETVKEDQAVAEVMTDKATVEIPAMHSGIVSKLYYKEGDIAKVHEPLFAMEQADAATSASKVNDKKSNEKIVKEVNSAVIQHESKVEAFILPDIGEGIVECEIMQWHVQEGDVVSEDQVVVEVMTDKAVVEIPAKYDGRILKLHYKKGDIAGVHTALFDQALNMQSDGTSEKTSQPSVDEPQKQQARDLSSADNIQGENFEPPHEVERAIASPAVRRLAKEYGVLLNKVKASGPKGRVLKQDVIQSLSYKENNDSQVGQMHSPARVDQSVQQVKQPDPVIAGAAVQDRVESIKGIRAAMAKQMMASVSTIPHFSVSDELCMDKLISLRAEMKPVFEAESVKLSFLPFFIKAMSLAMLKYPVINSRLNEQATELTYLSSHNIGIAVDSKIGLLVPNIKNVQNLSLFEVAKEINAIIDRAREGKLTNTDLTGGSISLSNIGAIGGITATPVINKPEVAIVALGKTQKLPRYNEAGKLKATNVMMINWSGDHRVIDGATMVKFNNLWMDYLCHPERMLAHLR